VTEATNATSPALPGLVAPSLHIEADAVVVRAADAPPAELPPDSEEIDA
jgi:hypothetical protein